MSTISPAAVPAMMDSQSYSALIIASRREMHAHSLYLAAAARMEKAQLYVIAHALRFTAAQEAEHAAVFRQMLSGLGTSARLPEQDVSLPSVSSAADLLAYIIRLESEESSQLYPNSACIAEQEGYPRIAAAFRRIAETEALHAKRFQQYADALAQGTLFRDSSRVSWLCLACGQFHTGFEPPEDCASCSCDRGHFIRSSFYPFALEG